MNDPSLLLGVIHYGRTARVRRRKNELLVGRLPHNTRTHLFAIWSAEFLIFYKKEGGSLVSCQKPDSRSNNQQLKSGIRKQEQSRKEFTAEKSHSIRRISIRIDSGMTVWNNMICGNFTKLLTACREKQRHLPLCAVILKVYWWAAKWRKYSNTLLNGENASVSIIRWRASVTEVVEPPALNVVKKLLERTNFRLNFSYMLEGRCTKYYTILC